MKAREGVPRSSHRRRTPRNPSAIVSSEIPPRRKVEVPWVEIHPHFNEAIANSLPELPPRAAAVLAALPQRILGEVLHEDALGVVAKLLHPHAVVGLDHDVERFP